MGIIDSISEGLSLVRRRPLMMALPIVLDLSLWLAPQLSVEPLARTIVSGLVMPQGVSAQQAADSFDAAKQFILQSGKDANLLGLLASGLFGVPSVVGAGMPEGAGNLGGRVLVGNPLLAVVLALALTVVGVLVAAVYLTTVASAVRGEALPTTSLLAKVRRNWLRLLVLTLVLLVLAFAIGVPLTLLLTVASIFSPAAAAFLSSMIGLLALWAGLWVLLYLFFVIDAMMLHEVGLQRAIVNSIVVVRSSFWSSLGLILLVNVLAAGLSVVWRWLAGVAPAGLVVAIVGNAFVGSGLVAASLVFYRDRYEAWRNRVLQQRGGS